MTIDTINEMFCKVFEDETEAAKYCDLLQGNCEGVAEIEASSVTNNNQSSTFQICFLTLINSFWIMNFQVFDLCQKMRALAVLFRRGRTPPLPESLKLNLSARKRSLEDQDDVIWTNPKFAIWYMIIIYIYTVYK